VVRSGRPDKGMPRFDRTEDQIASLVAFIHTQRNLSLTRKGGRRAWTLADLQTGNAEAGKQYFNGPGGCAACHSPTGDLLESRPVTRVLNWSMHMLYPEHAKSTIAVTLPSGQTITGARWHIAMSLRWD
jgi:cytochrome c oxidase cbb3-type subunit 3